MNTHIKTYSGLILKLEPHQILVFDSNAQGQHNKGYALMAVKHLGAIYGRPKGPQGQCYAICTKDFVKFEYPTISKEDIIAQIQYLYSYAVMLDYAEFLIGYTLATNLIGYTSQEMANMFALAGPIPENIVFNDQFAQLIDTSLWASKTD